MADAEFTRFKRLLKDNGYFVTKPRQRLFGYLQSHPALSLKELIDLAETHDQTTVYRNVELFEKLGIINRLRLGWHTKIELSDIFQHHHHHMTCVNCGHVMTLADNPKIEREIARLCHAGNFKPMDHQLEIRGLCQGCS